ncbi:MAG: hypothetical protein OXQ90_01120 [Gammaproteobacteria bacterium]|nr:hypothetical protein [Gammaproteobacteria bacterium]
MDDELRQRLDKAHRGFFERFDVGLSSGRVGRAHVKFASYPFVGSRYGEGKKLMVVGLDIGDDEGGTDIQSYECRRKRVEEECPTKFGRHLAGTFLTAMSLLQEDCCEWRKWMEKACHNEWPQALLKKHPLPCRNPLSYIAFTNYYKFLIGGEVKDKGAKIQLDWEREQDFLAEEACALQPDAIHLQGAGLRHDDALLGKLSNVADVSVGYHPSVRSDKGNLKSLICPLERRNKAG